MKKRPVNYRSRKLGGGRGFAPLGLVRWTLGTSHLRLRLRSLPQECVIRHISQSASNNRNAELESNHNDLRIGFKVSTSANYVENKLSRRDQYKSRNS